MVNKVDFNHRRQRVLGRFRASPTKHKSQDQRFLAHNPAPGQHRRVFTTASQFYPAVADPFRLPNISTPPTPPNQTIAQPTPVSASKFSLPSLDFSQRQVGQQWPGLSVSQAAVIPPTTTLPTPPSAETESSRLEKPNDHYSMLAVLPPQGPMMHMPSLGSSSLTSRRTATNNLPGPLELPPNHLSAKFGGPLSSAALPTVGNTHSSSNISALLTPPSNIPGESLSPISSGSNSGSNPAATGLPPYTPTGYWSQNGSVLSPYVSGGTGSTPQPQAQGLAQPWNSSATNFNSTRGRFSPSLSSLMKNPNVTSPSESLPPVSYDLGALPPFPHTLGQSGPILPGAAPQQQQSMNYSMAPQATPVTMSSQAPTHMADQYMQKLPPTPSYYSNVPPVLTPQQAQFPHYSSNSPPVHSPLSANPPSNRISPVSQPVQQFARPYSGMHGIPMSNMHSPGAQMPIMGGPGMVPIFNSGHAAHLHHLYNGQPGQQPMDRPFKCDQCPQSFNRNHDLKRHKRIHLAVKPFPCGHCDKSFSRKDALKVRYS